jgi:hypothetical protein
MEALMYCSFCGKSKEEVQDILQSSFCNKRNGETQDRLQNLQVSICDECIKFAFTILIEKRRFKPEISTEVFNAIINKLIIKIDDNLINIIDSKILKQYLLVPIKKISDEFHFITYLQDNLVDIQKLLESKYNIRVNIIISPEEELIKRTIDFYYK